MGFIKNGIIDGGSIGMGAATYGTSFCDVPLTFY